MGIGELLDGIRDFYLQKFSSQIEELSTNFEVIIEPALLSKDGYMRQKVNWGYLP